MKTRFNMLLTMAVAVAGWSCQKPGEDRLFNSEKLGDVTSNALLSALCYEVLPSVIDADRTLDADSAYLVSGVVRVTNGAKLTAPAGTVFLGDHNANSKGFLVIEAGSKIEALGQCDAPVVFTSFAAAGNRSPGDWGGLFILGKASNNLSSEVMPLVIGGTNFTAGNTGTATNDADNSGILEYVQIHYAGYQPGGDTDPGALVMASVGSGTSVEHIQLTNTLHDGLRLRGGIAKIDYLFNLDIQNRDFVITNGNRSEMQFVAGVKKTTTSTAGNGYGLDISSDPTTIRTGTPYTHPVISNLTLLGPDYFSVSTANYENAIRFYNNGSGKIYNSVLTGYPQEGLLIQGNDAIANTASGTNPLEFSYNSFYGFTTNFDDLPDAPDTWADALGCDVDMYTWITGDLAIELCVETGNQIPVSTFAMNSSVAGDYCTTFPTYVLGTTTLAASNFSWDTGTDFDQTPSFRGAFPTSGSWVDDCWMDLCPSETEYCQ